MNLFKVTGEIFDLAIWEQNEERLRRLINPGQFQMPAGIDVSTFTGGGGYDPKQFIIFQIGGLPNKGVQTPSEVEPLLSGSAARPDINLSIDIDSFKLSMDDGIDPDTKVTLQLVVGQEQPLNNLEKLFYCINGGLDLFDSDKKRAPANAFKKSASSAFGNKPISLPGGVGTISLKMVQHANPKWWRTVFDFAKTDKARELISLIGFGGITNTALQTIGGMMDTLFPDNPEVLFKSAMVKAAFSKKGKKEIGNGSSFDHVSSLNEGYWLMAKITDYNRIKSLNPIYFSGPGLLAPEGLGEIEAQSTIDNPFQNITYTVIKARMKEVDLNQNTL